MNKKINKITVLGSGNTGFSTATKLSHDGFNIILAEIPEFESSIFNIKENKTILLKNKSSEAKTSIKDVTPSVVSVINSLDKECINIGKALGYKLQPIENAIHQSGLGPKGDLWSSINGSEILTKLKAPITVKNRWISEDIPYGIATWSMLGNQIGIKTPVMQSLTNIGSIISTDVSWEKTRNLSDLGIEKMKINDIKKYIKTGSK